MAVHRTTCTHCLQPLGKLALQRGLSRCDGTACRAKESLQLLEKTWSRLAGQALATAAQQTATSAQAWGPRAPQRVLWLETAERSLVPVTAQDRAYLAARWQQAWDTGAGLVYGCPDTAVELPADASALCAYCGGRCCTYGSSQAAFVDVHSLRRWLAAQPGATVEDAIADYLSRLPAEHVQGQCCFQGAEGCHLPRQHRSDVCNQYRCPALGELGAATAADADAAVVVLTREDHKLQAAAVFHRGAAVPLGGLVVP